MRIAFNYSLVEFTGSTNLIILEIINEKYNILSFRMSF